MRLSDTSYAYGFNNTNTNRIWYQNYFPFGWCDWCEWKIYKNISHLMWKFMQFIEMCWLKYRMMYALNIFILNDDHEGKKKYTRHSPNYYYMSNERFHINFFFIWKKHDFIVNSVPIAMCLLFSVKNEKNWLKGIIIIIIIHMQWRSSLCLQISANCSWKQINNNALYRNIITINW